jgi:hypothetical protein
MRRASAERFAAIANFGTPELEEVTRAKVAFV